MRKGILLFAGLVLLASEVVSQTLDLNILVTRKDRVDSPAQVFPDVGGFAMRQLSGSYDKATCPNASDAKGELRCRVTCSKEPQSLRLYLQSPNASVWPAVRGYSQPADVPLDISACKLSGRQPVSVTYKAPAVLLSELVASSPGLATTIVAAPPNWDGRAPIKIAPFETSSATLEKYSQTPEGRIALVKLAEFSTAYAESSREQKNPDLEKTLDGYRVGSKSIFLKASVTEALGKEGATLVKVSPSQSDFLQSVSSVERTLGRKPSLSSREVTLIQEVKELKQADRLMK